MSAEEEGERHSMAHARHLRTDLEKIWGNRLVVARQVARGVLGTCDVNERCKEGHTWSLRTIAFECWAA